jgi:hypothetical protein
MGTDFPILIRGPVDAAVLRTIHLLGVDDSCRIPDDLIQQPRRLDCPDVKGFGKHWDHLCPGVVTRTRIHLVDENQALVGLA